MKVLFIYELFFEPFDEGVKKFSQMIHSAMSEENSTRLIRDIRGAPRWLNGMLLVPRVLFNVLVWRPDRVVYIPKGAMTLAGFIKAWLIDKCSGVPLSVVGVQKKRLGARSAAFVQRLRLKNLFVLSKAMVEDMKRLGQAPREIMAGIDRNKFSPSDDIDRLRSKYAIPGDRPVLLHVGHIRTARNIAWLGDVQTRMPDLQVVLVGSTTTQQDLELVDELEGKGVVVIRQALPDIHEIYQLADWYCFPVQIEDAAMEVPLSVLEAMSTNLPIVTTRFGRLPELFEEDTSFRYVDSADELIGELQKGKDPQCNNREKTRVFTWQHTARLLLAES